MAAVDPLDDPAYQQLIQDRNCIVIRRRQFNDELMSLTTEAYSHAWLEDRYYPLIEHILKHYCLAMYALGSSMAPSPQRVFLDTPNPITDEPSSRQHRTPDAAMITSFRGTLPFPPRNIPPSVLGFFWEAKAEEHDCNWNSTMSQTNCIAKMVPHLLQLRMQAKYAFRHFGGTEYHAFLSLGFFWTLVKLKKRSKPEDDGKLLHAADPGPGPSSRKRRRQDSEEPSPFIDVSEDDLPDLEPIYFCEPMFEGNWAEIKVHPLLLHALQLASANVPTSVQPSFMQPEPDYVPPVNPSATAIERAKKTMGWRRADRKAEDEFLNAPSSSPQKSDDHYQPSDGDGSDYESASLDAVPRFKPVPRRQPVRAASASSRRAQAASGSGNGKDKAPQ